jgi:hypothetical protein
MGMVLFDHVTLENVAAACFGYVETNVYVAWRHPKAVSKRVRWNNISKKTDVSEVAMQEQRRLGASFLNDFKSTIYPHAPYRLYLHQFQRVGSFESAFCL